MAAARNLTRLLAFSAPRPTAWVPVANRGTLAAPPAVFFFPTTVR